MEGKNEIEKSSFRIVDLLQRREDHDNDKPMELTRKTTQSSSSSSTSSRSSSQEHSPKNSSLRHGHNRGGSSGHNHISNRFGSRSQNNFQFLSSSSRPPCNVPSSPESPEICNGREGNNETPPEVRPVMHLPHPAMYPYHHAHFPNLGSTFPRLFGTEAHMLSNMPLSVETMGQQHRHHPSSFMTTSPPTSLNGTNPFFHNHQLRSSQQLPPDFSLWNGNGPHGSGVPNSMISSYTDPRLYEYADNYPASSLLTRLACKSLCKFAYLTFHIDLMGYIA